MILSYFFLKMYFYRFSVDLFIYVFIHLAVTGAFTYDHIQIARVTQITYLIREAFHDSNAAGTYQKAGSQGEL